MTGVSAVNSIRHKTFSAFKSNNAEKKLPDAKVKKERILSYKNAAIVAVAAGVGAYFTHRFYGERILLFAIEKFGLKKLAKKLDKKFVQNLANDMSKELGKNVQPENLSSVVGKYELISILPKFKNENYSLFVDKIDKEGKFRRIYNQAATDNGIFKLDLHSHTNYSDGTGKVEEILENVLGYANKFHAKTGEKFIFAITDHDVIGGTKEALRIISENPQKYKNLRFVPGVELSFAHSSGENTVKISEMLAYGINPYSKSLNAFIDKTQNNRRKMFENAINELNTAIPDGKFSLDEMQGYFVDLKKQLFKYNLHYRLNNYVQIKQRIVAIAKKSDKNPSELYREIFNNWHVGQDNKTPKSFENLLRKMNIDFSGTEIESQKAADIIKKYIPHKNGDTVVAPGERTFDEMIESLSKERSVILAFAHPAFTAQGVDNYEKMFLTMIKNSKGLIKGAEIYHQSYSIPLQTKSIKQELIDKVNAYLKKLKLLSVGGHDNHRNRLL